MKHSAAETAGNIELNSMDLTKSRFTEYLVRLNTLRFKRWVFEPGMLFSSESKWWGDKGPRGHRHNGLDLRLYEDDTGTLKTINADTKIPIIYEGKIARSIEDFLGHTLFAAHEIYEGGSQLFTLYGHVLQGADVFIGKSLSEGAAIATLAGAKNMKVPGHLHISVALIPKKIPIETLMWKNLNEADMLFFDPRGII